MIKDFVKANNTTLIVDVHKNEKKLKSIEVPLNDLPENMFTRKSTVIYGTSGSGKSILTRHIMYNMKNYFPRVWIFCPTNAQNQMYTGFIPNALIFENPTYEIIKDIYEYQKVARQIYDTSNKIETLRSLFMKIPNNQKALLYEHELFKLQQESIKLVKEKHNNPVVVEEKCDKITQIMTEKLREHYKQMIGLKADKLALMELTEEERYSLRYIGFCPDSLVIFDDAMMEVAELIKKSKKNNGDSTIPNFFFKGRHLFITSIYCVQSDKVMDPDLRKNAHVSIFTSSDEAIGFFTKASNGVAPEEKRDACACISEIFSEKNKSKHWKFVYLKDSMQKYQYCVASLHTRFNMCGDSVRKFCERVEEKSKSIDKTSKFAKKFNEYTK